MSMKRHVIAVVAASLVAIWLPSAAGQVMGDEACPYYAVDHASFATCDGDRVARAGSVSFIAPTAARELKLLKGQGRPVR